MEAVVDGQVVLPHRLVPTGQSRGSSDGIALLVSQLTTREREVLCAAETDEDGRVADLGRDLEPGRYALVFWPPSPFFSRVELEVELVQGHYHVPLLFSPYGCASYRGS